MAAGTEGDCTTFTLRQMFDHGFDLHRKIESSDDSSSSECLQKRISSAVESFVNATKMVNNLGLYSTNEELEEVSTSDLRYLLSPALLGDLTVRQMSSDRLSDVKIAKIYFIDFLKRCKDYGISKVDIFKTATSSTAPESAAKSLQQLACNREEKIRRYKEQKQQENRLKELQDCLEGRDGKPVDDEVQRDYFMLLLNLWVNKCVEHLASIEDELQILQHMEKMKAGKVTQATVEQPTPKRPVKPILITRDMLKSKVFGAGYPSLPTMSQEEYLEKEIREGKVVLDYDQNKQDTSTANEDEKEEKKSEDEDDPEKIQKARDWDDWRDDHRRGWGNRENMG